MAKKEEKLNLEEISFHIIANAGVAKSHAMLAIRKARANEIEAARKALADSKKQIIEVGKHHMKVVQAEANNVKMDFSALLMHAEDQYLTTQMLIELADEFIHIYEKINK